MREPRFLPRERLQELLDYLVASGYALSGPQVRDQAIVYQPLHSVDQLPNGISDEQQPGSYRLHESSGVRTFAWANGPQALKPMLFLPREALWRSSQDSEGHLAFSAPQTAPQPMAVFGVRACDLAALAVHDRHFLSFRHRDPAYRTRRNRLFLVAVNCTHPAATCFCASTGDGPRAEAGYDLLLDELDDGFVIRSGSLPGDAAVAALPVAPVSDEQLQAAARQDEEAVRRQSRTLPGRDLQAPLFANLEHPRWKSVAERCLACGNCTSVCPTCFCHSEFDEAGLELGHSEHFRQWQSCFSEEHSYIHGYVIRAETHTRYRQWLTHKLGSWHEQYGRSGCVGCGRCISWCPVGIDITEEAHAICNGGEA